MVPGPPSSTRPDTLFPYTTLSRSRTIGARPQLRVREDRNELVAARHAVTRLHRQLDLARCADRHLDRPRNPGERRRRPDSLDRRVGHRRARPATSPTGGRLAVDARTLDILVERHPVAQPQDPESLAPHPNTRPRTRTRKRAV